MIVSCGLSESPFQKVYQIWESYDFDPSTVVIFPNHRSCRHFQKEIQSKLSNAIFPRIYSITNLFYCDVQPVDVLNILSADLRDIPMKTIYDLAVEITNSIKELILNKIDYRTLQNQVPQELQPYWSKTQHIFQRLDKIISQLEKIRDHQIKNANIIIEESKVIAVELGMANLCVIDFLKNVEKSIDNVIVLLSLEAPINRKIKSSLFENIPYEKTLPMKNHIEKAVFQNTNEEILGVAIAIRQAVFENKKVLVVTQSQDFTYKLKEQLSRWNIVPDAALGTQLIDTFEGKLLVLTSEVLQNNFDCNSMINLLKACEIDINSFEIFRRKLTLASNNFFDCYKLYDKKSAHILEVITFIKKLKYNQQMSFRDWVDLSYAILNAISNKHSNILKNNEFYNELSNNITMTSNEFASFLHSKILTQTTQKPTGYTKNVVIVGAIEAQLLSADLIILACVNTENLMTKDNNTFLTKTMKQGLNIPTSEHQNDFIASIFERLINQPNVLITRSLYSNDAQQMEYPLLKNYSITDSYIKNLTSTILYNIPLTKRATRPLPVISVLPSTISVSNLDLLINNPYAFYVQNILKLKEIPPLIRTTTIKGNFIHEILHRLVQKRLYSSELLWEEAFKIIECNGLKISDIGPTFFQLQTVFDFFIKNITNKSNSYTEIPGKYTIKLDEDLGEITLICRADRLDIDQNGLCSIIDYKTGTPPSSKEVKSLKKIQLLAEAIIAKNDGFTLPISSVVSLQYWHIKNAPKIIAVINEKDMQTICDAALDKIKQLLQKRSYEFIASAEYNEIYKHLARYKEWRID